MLLLHIESEMIGRQHPLLLAKTSSLVVRVAIFEACTHLAGALYACSRFFSSTCLILSGDQGCAWLVKDTQWHNFQLYSQMGLQSVTCKLCMTVSVSMI